MAYQDRDHHRALPVLLIRHVW